MPDILSICLLISFLCLVSGLFSPESVIRFGNLIPKTQSYVLKLYGSMTIVLFGAYLLSTAPMSLSNNTIHSTQNDDTQHLMTEELINHSPQFQIGEIVSLNELELQIISISTISSDSINKAKEGYEFLEVELMLKNNSEEVISYNQFQFSLTDLNNTFTIPTFNTLNNDTALNFGEVRPNEVVSGTIVFEVLKDSANKFLIYQSQSNVNKQTICFNLDSEIETFERLTSTLETAETTQSKRIGEIISIGDVELQVLAVNTFEDKENFRKKYLQVELTLKNNGQSSLVYYPFNFKLINGTVQSTTPLLSLSSQKQHIGMGELVSGGTITGTIVFEQPNNQSDFFLLYEPSQLFNSDSVKVNLQESIEMNQYLEANDSLLANKELLELNEEGSINKVNVIVTQVSNTFNTIYQEPKDGYQYVVLDVKLTNDHTTPVNYSMYDFKIMNKNGQLSGPIVPILDEEIEIKSGKLASKESIEGIIVFERPIDEDDFYLMYTSPSILSNDVLWFNLNE